MPGSCERRLEKMAKKEKDRRAKFGLLACRGRKRGHSIRRVSRDLGCAFDGPRLAVAYARAGPEGQVQQDAGEESGKNSVNGNQETLPKNYIVTMHWGYKTL